MEPSSRSRFQRRENCTPAAEFHRVALRWLKRAGGVARHAHGAMRAAANARLGARSEMRSDLGEGAGRLAGGALHVEVRMVDHPFGAFDLRGDHAAHHGDLRLEWYRRQLTAARA